jgi:hypothetical protein
MAYALLAIMNEYHDPLPHDHVEPEALHDLRRCVGQLAERMKYGATAVPIPDSVRFAMSTPSNILDPKTSVDRLVNVSPQRPRSIVGDTHILTPRFLADKAQFVVEQNLASLVRKFGNQLVATTRPSLAYAEHEALCALETPGEALVVCLPGRAERVGRISGLSVLRCDPGLSTPIGLYEIAPHHFNDPTSFASDYAKRSIFPDTLSVILSDAHLADTSTMLHFLRWTWSFSVRTRLRVFLFGSHDGMPPYGQSGKPFMDILRFQVHSTPPPRIRNMQVLMSEVNQHFVTVRLILRGGPKVLSHLDLCISDHFERFNRNCIILSAPLVKGALSVSKQWQRVTSPALRMNPSAGTFYSGVVVLPDSHPCALRVAYDLIDAKNAGSILWIRYLNEEKREVKDLLKLGRAYDSHSRMTSTFTPIN